MYSVNVLRLLRNHLKQRTTASLFVQWWPPSVWTPMSVTWFYPFTDAKRKALVSPQGTHLHTHKKTIIHTCALWQSLITMMSPLCNLFHIVTSLFYSIKLRNHCQLSKITFPDVHTLQMTKIKPRFHEAEKVLWKKKIKGDKERIWGAHIQWHFMVFF